MTRHKCEERIMEALKEIDAVVRQYNPTNTYLSASIMHRDGITSISFNNAYWVEDDGIDENGADFENPIKFHITIEDGTTNA